MAEPNSLTVSELTAQVKDLLEGSFPDVWVVGEISNFARPQSGHCYFSLKDDHAQIRGVMWRGVASRLKFDLEDGLEVLCRGHLDVYAPRGSYQLVVDSMQPQGMGALELALRKLQEKLAKEGLFDADRKQPLPRFPKRIGFVTSPTGAAVRDFLEVLRRRWSGAHVLVIPSRVQGDGAAAEIAAGIRAAHRVKPKLNVLVVGRGGGSLEDLWAFNEEVVVRAIAAASIPVISAVGHEIDVSLSDLAADVRALTPSEAAERVLPSQQDVREQVKSHQQRMHLALARRAERSRSQIDALANRRALRRPFDVVHDLQRRLDELSVRGQRAAWQRHRALDDAARAMGGKLHALSPLAVLGRGYTITHRADDTRPVRNASALRVGQQITTRFEQGQVRSTVDEVNDESD